MTSTALRNPDAVTRRSSDRGDRAVGRLTSGTDPALRRMADPLRRVSAHPAYHPSSPHDLPIIPCGHRRLCRWGLSGPFKRLAAPAASGSTRVRRSASALNGGSLPGEHGPLAEARGVVDPRDLATVDSGNPTSPTPCTLDLKRQPSSYRLCAPRLLRYQVPGGWDDPNTVLDRSPRVEGHSGQAQSSSATILFLSFDVTKCQDVEVPSQLKYLTGEPIIEATGILGTYATNKKAMKVGWKWIMHSLSALAELHEWPLPYEMNYDSIRQ